MRDQLADGNLETVESIVTRPAAFYSILQDKFEFRCRPLSTLEPAVYQDDSKLGYTDILFL